MIRKSGPSKARISPLRLISKHGIKEPCRNEVTLTDGTKTYVVPLRTQMGFLQGVYRTPSGEIVEIRHTPENRVLKTLPVSRRKFVATPKNDALVHGTEPLYTGVGRVAEASFGLHHFRVNPQYRGQGIGEKLLSVGTRALAAKQGGRRTVVKIEVAHPDTAAMLKKRGWVGITSADRKALAKITGKQKGGSFADGGGDIWVFKFVKQTRFDDPSRWHQIEIIGAKGKTNTLLIPVKPSKEEQAELQAILNLRHNL